MIHTTVEEAGPCRRKLKVEVAAEKVAETYDELLKLYGSKARIPGFRPGRAPRPVVARRYAKEIREDLRERLVPEAYHAALEQEKISSVAILGMEPGEIAENAPFTFEVTVDVAPEFELPLYKGIAVPAEPVADVEDKDVEDMIERLRATRATYEEVEGRPLAEHDLARIDFRATMDGKPLAEAVPSASALDKGEGFQISLDEAAFLPELAAGLMGATVGEERDIDVTFPEGFTLEDLRGKSARFHVTVTGIRERRLPEADDALARQMNADGIEGLRARIREELTASRKETEEGRVRSEIARHLIEAVNMDLPESVVSRATQSLVYDRVRENARRGVPEDQIVQHKQEIYEHAVRDARGQLALTYVLHRIAETEKIAVTDEDLETEIEKIVAGAGPSTEAMRKRLADTQVRDDLRERILSSRVMDFLRREAKVETAG